jgi:hypothetical protein
MYSGMYIFKGHTSPRGTPPPQALLTPSDTEGAEGDMKEEQEGSVAGKESDEGSPESFKSGESKCTSRASRASRGSRSSEASSKKTSSEDNSETIN